MTNISHDPPKLPPLWQRRWFQPAAIAAAALAMLVWTWGTWPDVLVDFGVQLYVPWRLAAGEVLYRDIAHYTGPLSIYYNALAFRIFGPSFLALVLWNLPILAGIFVMIYCLCEKIVGRIGAFAANMSFTVLFAFSHLTPAGNYNYVCPYEYEYTHATLLCLGVVIFVSRMLKTPKPQNAGVAGFLVGLVFLTRAEFFIAAMAVVGLGFALLAWENKTTPRLIFRNALTFLLTVIIPPLVSIGALDQAMPLRQAIRGTAGMWPMLLAANVTRQQFYLHSMGIDDFRHSLSELLAWSARYLGIVVILAAWARLAPQKWTVPNAVAATIAGAGVIALRWRDTDWISAFRPLPILVLIVTSAAIALRLKRKSDAAALAALLGLLALMLLGKIFLYARIEHYGCWLAMPATMLLVGALFGWIPSALRRSGANAPVYLAGISGLWIAVLFVHLIITGTAIGKLTVIVGSGPDQFLAADRGDYINRAVAIAKQFPENTTIDCFPEGIMINYLSRRKTSVPYVNFNPPDLLLFGQSNMLKSLQAHPPDYIFIVHKDTGEFHVRFFGANYGQDIYAWITTQYHLKPVPLDLGAFPLRDDHFGIRLLEPNASPASMPR
jgi:hypothetical protein